MVHETWNMEYNRKKNKLTEKNETKLSFFQIFILMTIPILLLFSTLFFRK